MTHFALDIFNLLPDDLLLEIAHTCDIDVGDTHSSRQHSLSMIRGSGGTEAIDWESIEVMEN